MTEKRFKISFDNNQNIYDKEEKCYYSSIDAEKLCDLLNDLEQEVRDNEHYHSEVLRLYKAVSEENRVLKEELEHYRAVIDKRWSEYLKERGLDV